MRIELTQILCCPGCHGELLLNAVQQSKNEVTEGSLKCRKCKKHFPIVCGIPSLVYPENLLDPRNAPSEDSYADNYDRGLIRSHVKLGILSAIFVDRIRKGVVKRLNLHGNERVVEIASGTGSNLMHIAGILGKNGELHSNDLSQKILIVAKKKLMGMATDTNPVQANMTYLPYRSSYFDAVLHVGTIAQLEEQKRALEEMIRIAKRKAKIVIVDEGLSPEKAATWHGNYILKRAAYFGRKPPLKIIPNEMVNDVKVSWVMQNTYWVLEFTKN
jgi:ubiquinone/menaquinone biosynthesis C-methylase UbiE/uncharacterized protein YbaR (Trm112 family)